MRTLMHLIPALTILLGSLMNVAFATDRLAACDVLTGLVLSDKRVLLASPRGQLLHLMSTEMASGCGSTNTLEIEQPGPAVSWTGIRGGSGALWLLGQQQTLLSSEDFGVTWQVSQHPKNSGLAYMDLLLPKEPESNFVMYAVGTRGLYTVSEDGGKTWMQHDLYIDPEWDEPEDFNLNAIVRLKSGGLLVAGEAGSVYWSKDGEVWEKDHAGSDATWFGAIALPKDGALLYGFGGAMAYVDAFEGEWTLLPNKPINSQTKAMTSSLFAALLLPSGKLLLAGQYGTLLEWGGQVDSNVLPIASGTEATITDMAWQQGRLFFTSDQGYGSLVYE